MHREELVQLKEEIITDYFQWQTFDGLKLWGMYRKLHQDVNAVIIFVHDLGEHGERYLNWTGKFVNNGYIVGSYDLRGHGRSEGKRGYASTYRKHIKDLLGFLERTRSEFPEIPVILYGHGLGGNIITNCVISNKVNVAGLIIASPWFEFALHPSRIKFILAGIVKNIIPGLITRTGLNAVHLSRNTDVVRGYVNDPLVHDKISLRLLFEIVTAGQKALKSIYKINIPILVMHGTLDKVTSCRASEVFTMNTSEKTTFKEWEGNFHELHNDLDADKVFRYVLNWLNALKPVNPDGI